MNYGSWTLNHPVKAVLIFSVFGVAGGLCGVGVAWLTTAEHWISDQNVLAGMGMGSGGVLAGFLCGMLLLTELDRRSRR